MLVYFIVRNVLGPINYDEVFFSHILWLTLQGERQYVDFYSQHLPTYFGLYSALLPRAEATDLSFISIIRYSNSLIVLAYIALIVWLDRRRSLFLMPLMLVFVVISRMVEIRPDTIGLLLFNAGWVVLIRKQNHLSLLAAAGFALAGAAFSARGVAMGLGFALALLTVVALRRDVRGFVLLCGLGVTTLATAIGWYLSDHNYVILIMQSSFLEPAELLVDLSATQRLLGFDRSPQLLLTSAALIISVWSLAKKKNVIKAAIITVATTSQLLLVVLDPSPFPYVYAWAILPALAGLGLLQRLAVRDERPFVATFGTVAAAAIAVMIGAYPLHYGRAAGTGSNYRFIPDGRLSDVVIERLPTNQLVELVLSGKGQHSFANQVAVRRELCQRIDGPVLSVWQFHPICLPDSTRFWYPMKWPNIWQTRNPPKSTRWFEMMFEKQPPKLFIWGAPGSPPLNTWATSLLKGYEVHEAYALKEPGVVRKFR